MIDATPEFIIAEVRFDTVIIQTNAMGMTTNINSTSEGNLQSSNTSDVMSCIMNRLSKNGLFAKMDYSGKVVELINTKMLSDIILKDTSMITGQTAATVKMQIKNMVSDKALKTMVETFTYYLPGRQVSKGDKWEINQTTSSGGMALDITTSYVLTDLQGNKASIAAEANIKASDNAGPLEYGGAKITYGEVKGISKAEMLVDATTGLLLQSTEKSHIAGSLSVSAPGVSMQIPMEIDSSSKVTAMP